MPEVAGLVPGKQSVSAPYFPFFQLFGSTSIGSCSIAALERRLVRRLGRVHIGGPCVDGLVGVADPSEVLCVLVFVVPVGLELQLDPVGGGTEEAETAKGP